MYVSKCVTPTLLLLGYEELRTKPDGIFTAMLNSQDVGSRENDRETKDDDDSKTAWLEQEKERINDRSV